jgi:uncharacterized protein (TIGR02246 family)
MSIAGVVVYQIRQDGTLEGYWTHRDLGGTRGAERARGGVPGQLTGRYEVEIEIPGGQRVFQGSLTIEVLGTAYALVWSGTQLLPSPRAAGYSGIGVVENGFLTATFQEDDIVDEIRKQIEAANVAFGKAYASGVAANVSDLYTTDAAVLPPGGPRADGRAAIEAFWGVVMSGEIKNVELKTVEIEVFGETVVEAGNATLLKADGSLFDRGKYLVVWKRDGGRWRLHRDCWNSNGKGK